MASLFTEDGPWGNLLSNPTEDSPWSVLLGPIVCSGFWSLIGELVSYDSPWSDFESNPTVDSPWSDLIGPIVCSGEWSPFGELFGATMDGPWSDFSSNPTMDGRWSNLQGNPTMDGPWSDFISEALLDGPWSDLSNLAHRGRPAPVEALVYHSVWSAVSNMAHHARSSELAPTAYDSAWSAVSNTAHRARIMPPVLVIASGAWSGLSNVAHRGRSSEEELVWFLEWSDLSNLAHWPRPTPVEQILYHGPWSDVSNVAVQERIVLSAIGGAEPFLHIYDARRGEVRVNTLAPEAGPALTLGGPVLEAMPDTADADNNRAVINPPVYLSDLRDERMTIDVHRTTDATFPMGDAPVLFYVSNVEGVDPNPRTVLYNVTPAALFPVDGVMPELVQVSMAPGTVMRFERFDSYEGETDIADATIHVDLSAAGLLDNSNIVVVSLLPTHDNNRLSRIEYNHQNQNHWHYYHGVEEIFVSDPIEVVADEDAYVYSARDSANLQSPPHVYSFSAVVRQHQDEPFTWFTELLNQGHVITGQRVHMLVVDENLNYDKAGTGIMQTPQFTHRDNIFDWRMTADDPTALMVGNFANSTILHGPGTPTTVGQALIETFQGYANQHNLDLYLHVLDPSFDADDFPVPLAWFWTNFESERNIAQRLVNTQGPPASFYVNKYGC